MTPLARTLALAPLLLACTEQPEARPESAQALALAKTKDAGGANGNFDYCDGATLCDAGEGDCDVDAHCSTGNVCIQNNGANYGFYWTLDMCAPDHCDDGALSGDETSVDFGGSCGTTCGGANGDADFCKPGCECDVGEGDCDADTDCSAGNVCGINNGSQYGLYWTIDVCVAAGCTNGVQDGTETGVDIGGDCGGACGGVNGDEEGFCTEGCPCGQDEGDCDSALECEPGMKCLFNKGADVGLDPLDDICSAPYAVTDLEAGDLVITEIMYDPVIGLESGAEYFEIYNASGNDVNLNGLYVQDTLNISNFTVAGDILMPSGAYFAFTRGGSAVNGGITPDYDYPNAFTFANNGQDSVVLKTANGGVEIDRVVYNPVIGTWPLTVAGSMELSRDRLGLDNNLATNWCVSTTAGVLTNGDLGSPKQANRICP